MQALQNTIKDLQNQLKSAIESSKWYADKVKEYELKIIDLKQTINTLQALDL